MFSVWWYTYDWTFCGTLVSLSLVNVFMADSSNQNFSKFFGMVKLIRQLLNCIVSFSLGPTVFQAFGILQLSENSFQLMNYADICNPTNKTPVLWMITHYLQMIMKTNKKLLSCILSE